MKEKGLGRVFPEAPFAVYAFLRTGLMLRSPAEEPELPPAAEAGARAGAAHRLPAGLLRDLAEAAVAHACNEVMSARLQVALAAAAVVS